MAAPLLLAEYRSAGIDEEKLGLIASIGLFFYAVGKLLGGTLCDFLGGRRMFLLGMVLSALATVAFGISGGLATFVLAWSLNRFVQSVGWSALVKIASAWFPPERLGTIMGVLALSYLFGDALAKLVLGQLLAHGLGWRGIFAASAAILLAVALLVSRVLRASPKDVGEEEPEARPTNLYGARGNDKRPESLSDLLLPLLKSPTFLLVCVMSFGLTVLRETFNFWTPTYLVQVTKLSASDAARWSGTFPFFGGLSILAAGYLSDRFFGTRRGPVMFLFLVPATLCLAALAGIEDGSEPRLPIVLISATGFLLIGPYAFLSGAISLDLGGKKASATAAGIADAVGYFGTVISLVGVARLASSSSWGAAMGVLATIAAVTVCTAGLYWWRHDRVRRPGLT